MKKCIVIGSFDAFHNGHRDLLLYGLGIFDKLIIIVSDHPSKKYWFTAEERCEMLKLAMADYADRIEVTVWEHGSLEVFDNGRGMPVDIHPDKKVSGVELIFTQLHSGG